MDRFQKNLKQPNWLVGKASHKPVILEFAGPTLSQNRESWVTHILQLCVLCFHPFLATLKFLLIVSIIINDNSPKVEGSFWCMFLCPVIATEPLGPCDSPLSRIGSATCTRYTRSGCCPQEPSNQIWHWGSRKRQVIHHSADTGGKQNRVRDTEQNLFINVIYESNTNSWCVQTRHTVSSVSSHKNTDWNERRNVLWIIGNGGLSHWFGLRPSFNWWNIKTQALLHCATDIQYIQTKNRIQKENHSEEAGG